MHFLSGLDYFVKSPGAHGQLRLLTRVNSTFANIAFMSFALTIGSKLRSRVLLNEIV